MKKILFSLVASLLLITPAFGYTIQPGDTPYGLWSGDWRTELNSQLGITDPTKMPAGVEVELDSEMIGARTQDSGWQKKDVSGTLTDVLDDAIAEVDFNGADIIDVGSLSATSLKLGDGTGTLTSHRCEIIPIELGDDQESAPDATTYYPDPITSSSLPYRDFASSTTSTLSFQWNAPPNFAANSVTAKVNTFISSATGPDGEGIAWRVAGCANINNTPWGCTPGDSALALTFGTSTQYAQTLSSPTSPLAIPNLVSLSKVIFTLERAVSDDLDTYAQKAGAVELQICYNIE